MNKNRLKVRVEARNELARWYLHASGMPEGSEVQECSNTDAYGKTTFWYEPFLRGQTNYCVIEAAIGNSWGCSIRELPTDIYNPIKSYGGL